MGLKPGDSGAGVKELQKALDGWIKGMKGTPDDPGLIGLVPDGTFGENTRIAVAEFQKSKGIDPSGWAGCETLELLDLPDGLAPDGIETLNECDP